MSEPHSNVPTHAKWAAGLWFVLLVGVWIYEAGYQPWGQAFTGVTTGKWWAGKSLREVEDQFEEELTSFQTIRPYYNWSTFWAFGQGDGTVIPGKNGYMFFRAMLNDPQNSEVTSDQYLALFRQVDRAYQNYGCPVFWLPVPEKAMIYPQHLHGPQETAIKRLKSLQRFVDTGKKMKLNMLDLPNEFLKQAPNHDTLFVRDDTHWSDAGLALAVDLIVKSLASHVTPNPQPLQIKSRTKKQLADLPGMLNFPIALRVKRHRRDVLLHTIENQGPPQFVLFGTSFSFSTSLAGHIGSKLNAIPEDHSYNGLTINDLLVSAVSKLDDPGNLKPGTPVIIEFPYRLLHKQDGLEALAEQFNWRLSPVFKSKKLSLQPDKLAYRNLMPNQQWESLNDDPNFFIEQSHIKAARHARLLRVRLKTISPPRTRLNLQVFYDMGSGFQSSQRHIIHLSQTRFWQSWLIPLHYKRKLPQRIRVDPVNIERDFEIGSIDFFGPEQPLEMPK